MRRVLVLAHTGREEAREVARACVRALTAHGIVVRLLAEEAEDLDLARGTLEPATSRPSTRRSTPAWAASWPW